MGAFQAGVAPMPRLTAPPSPEALGACIQGQLEALRHACSVAGMALPVLVDAPDWYAGFARTWTDLAGQADLWRDTLAPMTTQLPASVTAFDSAFTARQATISALADALASAPRDEALRARLADQIDELTAVASANGDAADALLRQVKAAAEQVGRQHALLQAAAAEALQTANLDSARIAALGAQIGALRSEIDGYNQAYELAQFEIGPSGAILVIGIYTLMDPDLAGAQLLSAGIVTLGTVLTAGSLAATIILKDKVQSLQSSIVADSSQMTALQLQVVALQAFEATCADLAAATAQSTAGMAAIVEGWSTFSQEAAAVTAAIKASEVELEAGDIAALKADIAAAAQAWAMLGNLARGLGQLDIEVAPDVYPIRPTAVA